MRALWALGGGSRDKLVLYFNGRHSEVYLDDQILKWLAKPCVEGFLLVGVASFFIFWKCEKLPECHLNISFLLMKKQNKNLLYREQNKNDEIKVFLLHFIDILYLIHTFTYTLCIHWYLVGSAPRFWWDKVIAVSGRDEAIYQGCGRRVGIKLWVMRNAGFILISYKAWIHTVRINADQYWRLQAESWGVSHLRCLLLKQMSGVAVWPKKMASLALV